MAKSSRARHASKRAKPHHDFPLFHHASGRWAKKVRQKLHYFGKVVGDEDGQAALALWLEQKDDLLAGRKPRTKADGLTVADLCNHFLTHKQSRVDSGELAARSFARYHANCAQLVKTLGRSRLVADLTGQDFETLRSELAKRLGPVALANEIQMTRSMFRYGYEAGLFDKPVRFGPGFNKPSAKTIRQARASHGPRMFTTDEIRAALKHATVNLKAMLLLAINGGLGNTDLALLPVTAVDVAGGWLDYPRAKTAIPRRIPLWPETIEAINAVLATRRNPNSQDDQGLLFIGRRGESYRGNHRGYRIHQESRRVFISAKVKGRSFYDLRRTFQTVAEGARDLVAVQSIMGHAPADSDMSAIYRQKVDDDRLRAVTDHVRKWLFGDGSNKAEGGDDHEANEADKLADQMRKQQEEVRSRATPPSEDVRVHGAGRSEGAVRLAR